MNPDKNTTVKEEIVVKEERYKESGSSAHNHLCATAYLDDGLKGNQSSAYGSSIANAIPGHTDQCGHQDSKTLAGGIPFLNPLWKMTITCVIDPNVGIYRYLHP